MTTDTMALVTGKGTTRRSIRIENYLWDRAQAKAEREGSDASKKVREFLAAYVEDEPADDN